jgi:acetyl-CoA carboxylase biotin carboxyl carrier protein
MREKEVRRLIQLVEESNIDELEISRWGRKVRITKRLPAPAAQPGNSKNVTDIAANPGSLVESSLVTIPPEEKLADGLVETKSPMVGTFYRAPAPDAKAYAEVGERVSVGQVICVIEAMKLMNEIESEVSGTIEKVLVENAQPVEFGQPLFWVRPEKS